MAELELRNATASGGWRINPGTDLEKSGHCDRSNVDWLVHALLLLQAESVQAGQVQSEQSELLGLAESEQVFKGRKCPQLSCTLPGLAIWALSHLFLPPTRLFKLWDVFQPSEYPTLPFYR